MDGTPIKLDLYKVPALLRLFLLKKVDLEILENHLLDLNNLKSNIIMITNIKKSNPSILKETRLECSKFGKVLNCYCHLVSVNHPQANTLRIFVEFDSTSSAALAVSKLNGRFYGGRKVSASIYDSFSYHNKIFE